MKVAIYARVSKDDKVQDPVNQLVPLREFAAKQGWMVVKEYVDLASGKNGARPAFERMWEDAGRHRFECLLFWALDRLTREGALASLTYLQRLKEQGVTFKSYTEQYIDSLGLFGEAVVGFLATIAKQERVRISERTKAGLERARRAGKRLGRPVIQVSPARLNKLLANGTSQWEMSRQLGCSRTAVVNAIARLNK